MLNTLHDLWIAAAMAWYEPGTRYATAAAVVAVSVIAWAFVSWRQRAVFSTRDALQMSLTVVTLTPIGILLLWTILWPFSLAAFFDHLRPILERSLFARHIVLAAACIAAAGLSWTKASVPKMYAILQLVSGLTSCWLGVNEFERAVLPTAVAFGGGIFLMSTAISTMVADDDLPPSGPAPGEGRADGPGAHGTRMLKRVVER